MSSPITLPRNCTFTESDWRVLSPFWYPVAFSHEVKDKPFAAKLLDERLVIFRLGDSKISITYRQGLAKLGLG